MSCYLRFYLNVQNSTEEQDIRSLKARFVKIKILIGGYEVYFVVKEKK